MSHKNIILIITIYCLFYLKYIMIYAMDIYVYPNEGTTVLQHYLTQVFLITLVTSKDLMI